jgi:hypothetical protein
MIKDVSTIKAIRAKCLDCSQTRKAVMFCPCDGTHGTACPLWRYRFGVRPGTAARRYGRRFLIPEQMPAADAALESLGSTAPASAPARTKATTEGVSEQASGNEGKRLSKGTR